MADLSRELETTLNLLRAQADGDGVCRTPQTELARLQNVSWSTIHRRLKRLEAKGYLEIEHVSGQPSIYRLMPEGRGRIGITGQLGSSPVAQFFRSLLGLPKEGSVVAGSPFPAPLHPSPLAQTVGREEILATLQENVAKRRPTLLVGPLGIGKSHILRHFATGLEHGSRSPERSEGTGVREQRGQGVEENPPTPLHPGSPAPLYLERVSPIKPALVDLAHLLHEDGNLEVEGIEAGYMEWGDVRKKIAPRRVHELATLVTACLKDRDYTLILDHLEQVTPTMLPHLDALMEVALVIAATDELKPSAQRLWWAFERIEVEPLSREQARQLLWQVADRDRVAQPQLFETRVLQQAGGNPLAIITMASRARTAQLSAQEIRGLQHGAGTRYISLTPALMVLGALIVAVRFVALGLNDRDLYVLAGLGYAVFFVMRYFAYRVG